MEEASSYVKGIIGLMFMTEAFRVTDVTVNWSFLSTHPAYVSFLHADLVFIGTGVAMIIASWKKVAWGVASGITYSIFGVALTLLDPDFFHFIMDPQMFIPADLAVSILYLVGTPVLAITLFLGLRAYQSLRMKPAVPLKQ
ncbi:MAG: hypothetical protein ACE5PO_01605 [Candidatus Bathyarchaeia archaeon]